MNVAGILGAPSLPKFTPRRASSPADEGAPAPGARRTRTPVDPRKHPPTDGTAPAFSSRPGPLGRPSRQGPGPVAVAGKSSPPADVPGRPPVAVQRIVEAAVQLRPEKVTRLRIELHPESLGELLIELVLRGGVVHGVVQTGSESEKNLVAAHLGRLRTSLEGKGIAVGELRVTVAGDSAEEPEGPRSLRRGRVDLLA